MKEDFLHYVWQFKKFDFLDLKTTSSENLTVINSGYYSKLAGPDFFNAQIEIDTQKWAGNVEIHLKSSDWYLHQHEKDTNYDNVILHVVWEHDTPIFRKDNSEIPVLELQNYVSKKELYNYNELTSPKSWIYCEKQISKVDKFIFKNWQERLFLERLERKSNPINQHLQETQNDWEAVLFCMIAKNFGGNTNGESFLKMAQSIPFSVLRKESFEVENIEALFFGTTNLLNTNKQDRYFDDLKNRWEYLKIKHQLKEVYIEQLQFFKHRPDNFPTVRLAQLAQVVQLKQNLFSKIVEIKTLQDAYAVFDCNVSEYWQNHYNFDSESPKKRKALARSFIDLLLINTIIPFQFGYAKSQGKEISETILDLLSTISPEKNSVIDKFSFFGIISKNAFETQSLLQLKKEYCDNKKCMQCAVGLELLKK